MGDISRARAGKLNSLDRSIVEGQLDSRSDNVLEIIKYCPTGYPMLLLVHPFWNKEPFPTIYWLSCPVLKERVSKLEDQGYLNLFKHKAEEIQIYNRKLAEAHRDYAQKRIELLDQPTLYQAKNISTDLYEMLVDSGVAGIRDKAGLKCLHGHYAHYLADRNNPVGEDVDKMIDIPTNCHQCSQYISKENLEMKSNKKRVAAIDFGSNSCRLLIAENSEGEITPVYYDLNITRLAAGVDASRLLNKDSVARTLKVLRKYRSKMDEYHVSDYRAVGTSALRDVDNPEILLEPLDKELDIEVEIISGEEEARLTYLGCTGKTSKSNFQLVIDIGGGSTEFIFTEKEDMKYFTLDMGAVRFTERYVVDPAGSLSDIEKDELLKAAKNLLEEKLHFNKKAVNLEAIGVGGTITTLATINLGITDYEPHLIEDYNLTVQDLKNIIQKLSSYELKKRKEIDGLQPKRADVILAGSIILLAILEYLNLEGIKISDKDILYGITAGLLNKV
ncbi:MAG: DUF501 domain-containing protein [Bacillota bacterium]